MMKKFSYVLLGAVFVLSACGEASQQYTIKRHMKHCKEVGVNVENRSGASLDKFINECMRLKGHKDFDVEEYR